MATVIRRKLAKLMEKDDTPETVSIARAEGVVHISKKELKRYSMLMTMLDADNDQEIGGQEGALFLRRSGLENDHLREVWRLASGGTSKLRLTRDDFFIACKLVAVAQTNGEPDMRPLIANEELPLADFHYDLVPEIRTEEISHSSQYTIKITVTDPTTFGSGLDKHTKYKVSTFTDMPQFGRKEMYVWRRFSDFEWLHKRLSTCHPAAIIPIFPEKRIVGNQDVSFIKERISALELYINKVSQHPILCNSLDFIVFVDATDAGLEASRRYIEDKAAEESDGVIAKGVDLVMNIAATGTTAPPLAIKPDEAFVEACAQHGAALARLTAAVRTSTALYEAQTAAYSSQMKLGKNLIAVADHESGNLNVAEEATRVLKNNLDASQRANEIMFSGESTSVSAPPVDAAAAAAFDAHKAASADQSIGGMFAGDFNDPYGALAAVSTATKSAVSAATAGPSLGRSEMANMLVTLGDALARISSEQQTVANRISESFYAPLAGERDKEAELGEAIKRRDGAIDKLQDANSQLQRRKKTLAGLKSTDSQYALKAKQYGDAVNKAEAAVSSRREELEKMTEVLKAEMDKVSFARRESLLIQLGDFAKVQYQASVANAESWSRLLNETKSWGCDVEAAKETVSSIAKRAEQKARSASQVRKDQDAKDRERENLLKETFGIATEPATFQGSSTQ